MRNLIWLPLMTLLPCMAQSRIDNWCIGDSIHVKWNGETFVFQGEVPFVSQEGGASISDTAGNLLFYTDGRTVWDSTHQIIEGGSSLSDSLFAPYGSSVAQSAMILPGFGDLGLTFYVFSRASSVGGANSMFVSTIRVDSLTGMARIDHAERRVLVFDSLRSETMTAVKHANGRDWWIISSHSDIADKHYSIRYKLLTPFGFSNESSFIVDTVDVSHYHTNLTASYSGDLMGFAAWDYLYLLNFDRCSGMFSLHSKITDLDEGFEWYSIEFSKSSTYMYACDPVRKSIYQIRTFDGILVHELPTLGGPSSFVYGQMRRAPDNSIYIAYGSFDLVPSGDPRSLYLGRIPYPDSSGFATGYDTFAVYLGGRYGSLALPHHPHYELGALEGSPCDTLSSQAVDTTSSLGGGPAGAVMPWLIYPNPVSTTLTVEHPAGARLVLHDLQGRSVRSFALNASPTAVSLDGIPDGLYVMVLRDRSGNPLRRSKVLVQR